LLNFVILITLAISKTLRLRDNRLKKLARKNRIFEQEELDLMTYVEELNKNEQSRVKDEYREKINRNVVSKKLLFNKEEEKKGAPLSPQAQSKRLTTVVELTNSDMSDLSPNMKLKDMMNLRLNKHKIHKF